MRQHTDTSHTKIEKSIGELDAWVTAHGYKGYEPFDGLLSFLRPLAFGNTLAERLLIQSVRLSPVNLRPILGIRPQESTKGRGYMAWGYLTMFKITKNPHYKDKAAACLKWLVANKSEGYTHHCWGNHFDFSSRGGKQAKYVPTIVWSSLIGQAFLDGYELLGEKKYLDVAADISDWILSLPRKQTQNGLCLAYAPEEESTVHNSNMLGAAMLARMATFIPNVEARRVAALAMAYSCNHQLPSGAWYYGEEINTRWIDNFHTGYNLDSLKCYMDSTGDRTYQDNLFRGFRYFKDVFFEPSGKPRYYHNRTYPVDIQCAAQAITTLANFSEYDSSSLSLAIKVAGWTLGNMQDKSGYFYYRMLPWFKVKIPMLHWGQATMYRGLALLLSKLDSSLVSITPKRNKNGREDSMLIHLVCAARPNFMKIAPLYHAMKKENWIRVCVVHTGQHYDINMFDAFFEDLGLPKPDIDLGVGSGTHAEQTGNVMIAYERVLLNQRPDLVVVVGDVNSTLAATLAASKLGVKVAHLEAGLRSFDRSMPEEINRMVTDVLADILWTPTREAGENLIREGVSPEKIQFVGNIMIDSLEMLRVKIESQRIYSDFGLKVRGYGVITFHRPSNVDSPTALKKLCEQLWKLSETIPLIFPIHPRTRANLQKNDLLSGLEKPGCFLLPEPQSYVRFMNLVANCLFVITDSGGIQEETTHLGIPCLTVRDNTERPVTVTQGTNQLCKLDDLILETERILNGHTRKHMTIELWDGNTAERIVASLKNSIL